MERIKGFLKDYGFNIEEIKDDKAEGFYCVNPKSGSEFVLDFTLGNFKSAEEINVFYTSLYGNETKIVYLIEVSNNIDEIVSFLENKEDHSLFLVYDKDDEIEFFLKDLWNVILSLKRQ